MNNFTYMSDRDFSNGRKYVGASDQATLAGINEYKSPYDLYAEWKGLAPAFKGNKRTEAGHRHEPPILAEYIKRSILGDIDGIKPAEGKEYEDASSIARDFIVSRLWGEQQFGNYHSFTEAKAPENDRHVAHADLLDLTGEIPIIVQAKNTGQMAADARRRNPFKGYARDDTSQNGIPIGVYLQEQWEMYCYGIPKAYVAVQIDGWDMRIYGPVEYRKKDVEKQIVLADRFLWHIDNDTPPTPQNWPDVTSMFPEFEPNTKSVVSDQDELDVRTMIAQLNKVTEKQRVLARRKLDLNIGIALHACEPKTGSMRNYLAASDGTKLASFSERIGQRRISLSRMEKEFPDLARQCEEAGLISQDPTTRQMRVAGAMVGSVDLFAAITYTDDGKLKKSRKKYTGAEKDEISSFAKSAGIKLEWERYSR